MLLICFLSSSRSALLSLHRKAVLRHDDIGQEMLLNLLLRNFLHYNLYDQVWHAMCCRYDASGLKHL